MSTDKTEQALPPLPETEYLLAIPDRPYDPGYITSEDGYTADQMRDYAIAAQFELRHCVEKLMEANDKLLAALTAAPPAQPQEPVTATELRNVIENYANAKADLALHPTHESAKLYFKLISSQLADMLAASPPRAVAPLNCAGESSAEHALRWATELACSMARKFYPEVPQFRPLPDLVGVISQIDNMTAGLERAHNITKE